jgi:hypothetical protein
VWDFSTDPEFQEKLDWADEFMRTKVEPLQYVINHPLDLRDPVRHSSLRCRRRSAVMDCGRAISAPNWVAPGLAR